MTFDEQVTSSMFGHSLALYLPIQVYIYNLYNSIRDMFVYFQETVEMSCPEDQKKVKSEKKVTFFQNVFLYDTKLSNFLVT